MINPEQKTYFERPLSQDDPSETFKKDLKKAEDLGTEKVSGYKCRKKRIETTEAMMGAKRKVRSIVWISDKFDMPLRTETEDGTVFELRNIKKEGQPKDLFEPPKGYKKVGNFMALFGEEPEEYEETDRDEEMPPGGFQIPEDIRKQLPKDFKLPFGDDE